MQQPPPNSPPQSGPPMPSGPPLAGPPPGYSAAPPAFVVPQTFHVPEAPKSSGSLSKWIKRFAPIALAIAILGGGAYLLKDTFGGSKGGASSPEQAAKGIIVAINGEDATSLATYVAPDELPDVRKLTDIVIKRAKEFGVSTDNSLGLDVKIDTKDLQIESMGKDVAKASLRADYELRARPDTWGPVLKAVAAGSEDSVAQATGNDALFDLDERSKVTPFAMFVRVNGGWYMSPLLTAAEYIRVFEELPAPNFNAMSQQRTTKPADPETATRTLAEAIARRDVDQLAEVLATPQWRVAVSYRSTINELLKRNSLDPGARRPMSLSIGNLKLATTKSSVTVNQMLISGTGANNGGRFSFSFDGNCFRDTIERESNQFCIVASGDNAKRLGYSAIPLHTVKEAGGYRVDLGRSAMDLALRIAPSIDQATAFGVLGRPELLPAKDFKPGDKLSIDFGNNPHAVVRLPANLKGYYLMAHDLPDSYDYDPFTQTKGEPLYEHGRISRTQRVLELTGDTDDVRVLIDRRCNPYPGLGMIYYERDDNLPACTAATVAFTLTELKPEAAEFPLNLSGEVAAGGAKLFTFQPPANAIVTGDSWQTSSMSTSARDSKGSTFYFGPGTAPFRVQASGPITVILDNTADQPSAYNLRLRSLSPGFDGKLQTNIAIVGSSGGTQKVLLDANKAYTIVATPGASNLDLSIEVLSGTTRVCSADRTVANGTERCTIPAQASVRELTVRVRDVGNRNGSVQLNLE